MDTGGGEPRALGHPCLAETVQQGLYSFSAELVLHFSSQEIFHGQQLWPVLPKRSLSWLPPPSQGTAFPVEVLLSVLI